jgi:membrane protein
MAKKVSRFQRLYDSVKALLDYERAGALTDMNRWHKFLHFWVLVWKSFTRNRCPVRAAALAYTTVLAIIPMLAVAVSITSSLLKKEGEEDIDKFIVNLVANVTSAALAESNSSGTSTNSPPQASPEVGTTNSASADTNSAPETAAAPKSSTGSNTNLAHKLPRFARDEEAVTARHALVRYIHEFIQNTRSGALGVTGSVLLIFAAISMLSRIEDTFNDIWGVTHGRGWFLRIVLYWGVISLVPILVIVALGLATGPHLEGTRKLITDMPFVGAITFKFLPIVVLCLTFTVFYALMPNTKVHWQAALVGGLAGGILFHLNNAVSVLYVSRVVSNSKIYGSLGLLPVFMIGLYFSWVILLFGAQVAFAFQNRATCFEEAQIENINQRGREFIALRIMTHIGQHFARGEPPPNAEQIAEALAVPAPLVQKIMETLCAARLVIETAGAEVGYIPARPLDCITCHDILQALRSTQGREFETREEPSRNDVYGEYRRIEEAERQAAGSVTMLALVNREQGQRKLTE